MPGWHYHPALSQSYIYAAMHQMWVCVWIQHNALSSRLWQVAKLAGWMMDAYVGGWIQGGWEEHKALQLQAVSNLVWPILGALAYSTA